MRTRVRTTLNNRSLDTAIKENKRIDRRSGDPAARRIIINTLKSFFKDKVNTSNYGKAYHAVNSSFTLSELGVPDQGFATIQELRDAIYRNPEFRHQIVNGMQNRMRHFFTRSTIDKNIVRAKQIPINVNNITIADIETVFQFKQAKAEIVFRLKNEAMNRFLRQARQTYTNFHEHAANTTARVFYKYIENIARRTKSTPKYIDELTRVAREFEGSNIVSFATFINNLQQGQNKLTINGVPSINDILSEIHWTQLVQDQLDRTMDKWDRFSNPARPPWLKERTGTFRESVKVSPDYKNKLLQYSFTPYYLRNEKIERPYSVSKQVENAIHIVAQRTVARDFNIVKA